MAPILITVPTASQVSSDTSKPYTVYHVRVAHSLRTTTVQKRYSDFAALHSQLHVQTGSYPPAPLPPKSWISGSFGKLGIGSTSGSPALIEDRRKGLEHYLQAIETSEDGRWRVCPAYRDFLALSETDRRGADAERNPFGKDRVLDGSDWLDKFADVKTQLQDARRWLTKREQATAPTAQHEASANVKKSLVRAGTLILALNEGLDRLSGKNCGDGWSGDRLGEGELRRRKDLISTARKERDGLDGILNTIAVKSVVGSISSPPKGSATASTASAEPLFRGMSAGRRVLGAPAKETEKTRELDNEGVLQLQKQVMQEQDEDVADLTKAVRRMREMGVQINEEVVLQNQLLGLLDEDADR